MSPTSVSLPKTDELNRSGGEFEGDEESRCFFARLQENMVEYLDKTVPPEVRDALLDRMDVFVDGQIHSFDDEIVRVNCRGRLSSLIPHSRSFVEIQLNYCHDDTLQMTHECYLGFTLQTDKGQLTKGKWASSRCDGNESRDFQMTRDQLLKIQNEILGHQVPQLSLYQFAGILYGLVGIGFYDEQVKLSSLNDSFSLVPDWLEHHTRECCGCLNEYDNGYESDVPNPVKSPADYEFANYTAYWDYD